MSKHLAPSSAKISSVRAVIYARYSSENQREASIEDQIRTCKARIEAEGWNLVATTPTTRSGAVISARAIRGSWQTGAAGFSMW